MSHRRKHHHRPPPSPRPTPGPTPAHACVPTGPDPCCSGTRVQTPEPIDNRPGLDALAYRVGTHGGFLSSMLAGLSGPVGSPLRGLRTRDRSDFSVGVLDAWAVALDVLTFYQERIANEGYLRTATERRSMLELARLIGYRLRPGVASNVHLAYTLEKDAAVKLGVGERSQSVPGPGETAQVFETVEELEARFAWNNLAPRSSRPQVLPQPLPAGHRLFLTGTATRLRPNDPLLVGPANAGVYRVQEARADSAAGHTVVIVRPWREATGLSDLTDAIRDRVRRLIAGPPAGPLTPPASVKAILDTLLPQLDQPGSVEQYGRALQEAASGLAALFKGLTGSDRLAAGVALLVSKTYIFANTRELRSLLGDPIRDPGLGAAAREALAEINTTREQILATLPGPLGPGDPDPTEDADIERILKQPDLVDQVNPQSMAAPEEFQATLQGLIDQLETRQKALADIQGDPLSPKVADEVRQRLDRINDLFGSPPTTEVIGHLDTLLSDARGSEATIATGPASKRIFDAVIDALVEHITNARSDPSTLEAVSRNFQADRLAARLERQVEAAAALPAVKDWVLGVSQDAQAVGNEMNAGLIVGAFGSAASRQLLDAVAGRYGALAEALETEIGRRVIGRFDDWRRRLAQQAGKLDPAVAALGLRQAISDLRGELSLAEGGDYPRLEPWLRGFIGDLENGATELETQARNVDPAATRNVPAPQDDESPSVAGTLAGDLLNDLKRPPAAPPRNATRLRRGVGDVLSVDNRQLSDLVPQLLIHFEPSLGGSLYPALANKPIVPSTQPGTVLAARVKAAPFGHNAPLKPVLDADGKPIGSEEWPIASDTLVIVLDRAGPSAASITVDATSMRGARSDRGTRSVPKGAAAEPLRLSPSHIDIPMKMDPDFQWEATLPDQLVARELPIVVNAAHIEREVVVTVGDQPPVTLDRDHPSRTLAVGGTSVILTRGGDNQSRGTLTIRVEIPRPLDDHRVLALDAVYDQIVPGSWVFVDRQGGANEAGRQVFQVLKVATIARADYGMTARVTVVTLDAPWVRENEDVRTIAVYRATAVYAQSEPLELADEPYDADLLRDDQSAPPADGASPDRREIELDGLYDGLKPGRWVIVSGERTDVPNTRGVRASELKMLLGVRQGFHPDLEGDKLHTTLVLNEPLSYSYRRRTVTIHGNVVRATHGQTFAEVLGSGSGETPLQSFTLKQKPLTYVSAPTADGTMPTLAVRVDNVEWHEVKSLAGRGPRDRVFEVEADDQQQSRIDFGNGEQGARLPTGFENVRATYRAGIGPGGNVRAAQVSQLATRPLGVKGVVNPLPATGGAGPEGRDQARRSAPRSVTALDRLVSVRDYEDFALTFAGIGKARALALPAGGRPRVHVTVAGVGDIPLADDGELLGNLRAAFARFGDPELVAEARPRALVLAVLAADLRLAPDFSWEPVVAEVRRRLLAAFGFEARDLGQDLYFSEVVATIQATPGIEYVDVRAFRGLSGRGPDGGPLQGTDLKAAIDQVVREAPAPVIRALPPRPAPGPAGGILPAELVLFAPDLPDTLILNEVIS